MTGDHLWALVYPFKMSAHSHIHGNFAFFLHAGQAARLRRQGVRIFVVTASDSVEVAVCEARVVGYLLGVQCYLTRLPVFIRERWLRIVVMPDGEKKQFFPWKCPL